MESFDILGFSPSYLSMVSDLLVKIFKKKIKIQIVKNLDSKDNAPYKISDIEYKEVYHTNWKKPSRNILMGVYKVKSKEEVYDFFKKNYLIDFNDYSNIIHPKADLALSVDLGKGAFCNGGVSIGPFADIGNLVTLNRHVCVGHHTRISDFCVLNPKVNIAGFCNIGEKTTLGMGVNVIDGVNIGKNTIIGASSLVNKDIPDNVVAYGIPAKVIRENK